MNARLPARGVPLLYLGTAHLSLGLAAVLAALWPHAFAGFFYHSWMVALVHLVTLGWITFSILGSIYLVGPLALRMTMPSRRADYVGYAFAIVGLIGMVAHFWIGEYGGMAWSAATITAAIMYMTVRIGLAIRGAVVHPAVKLHVYFACVNIWIAASTGVLIAFDKVAPFLGGFVLSNVFAHAHLAAIGWAMMMVVGIGYRMLPMTLPSKMPESRSMYGSAILLEVGVIGLFVTLLLRSAWAIAFGVTIVGGLAVFAWHVGWMLSMPAKKPVAAPRVDFGVLHAAGAAVSLVASVAIGLVLLVAPMSPATLHAAGAYGVLALVGLLAQMVVAMEAKLLPLATWCWVYADSGFRVPPPSPYVMRERARQAIVYVGWTIAVPGLAAGLALESASLVAVGAWSLVTAVVVQTIEVAVMLWPCVRPGHAAAVTASA